MATRVKPNDSKAEKAQGLRLWALSDGTSGMHAQCVAMANAVKRHRADASIAEFKLSPHPLLRALPWLGAWLADPATLCGEHIGYGGGWCHHRAAAQGEFPIF